MHTVVLVSNRVATIVEGKPSVGGLTVAVVDALKDESCLWMGWNGEVVPIQEESHFECGKVGSIQTRTWPLSQRRYEGFYRGFSNAVIWPAFHHRLDHMRYSHDDYEAYLQVNQTFAERLAEHAAPNDVIWVHDYHFMHLGYFCRKLGMRNKIGFFLHIPFPNVEIFKAIPVCKELSKALCAFDLVGFQTQSSLRSFLGYLNSAPHDKVHAKEEHEASGSTPKLPRLGAYPISIDCASTLKEMEQTGNERAISRLRRRFGQTKIIISVDRLDYTKGLVERLQGCDEFVRADPAWRNNVSFMQISPPSRTDVHGYRQIRQEVELLTSQINGKWATPGWTPINYINRCFDRSSLLSFFRHSHVGLVTSLRDGMNLVAKEYVIAQAPENPGVLILSEFAGAAEELCVGALIINPYDAKAISDAIEQALSMGVDERRRRHAAMMKVLGENDLQAWKNRFLKDLCADNVNRAKSAIV